MSKLTLRELLQELAEDEGLSAETRERAKNELEVVSSQLSVGRAKYADGGGYGGSELRQSRIKYAR